MICADLPPAAEIRCLDQLNLKVNREIGKLRAKNASCPFPTDDTSDMGKTADCDCYATEKARRLREMGYSARTRIVYLPKINQFHRVTEVNGRVFDNLSPWTYPSNETNGIWIGK